jgi:hypothetical protein
MAVQLTPQEGQTPRWLYGDTPDGGTSACLARTVNFIREEIYSGSVAQGNAVYQTWVSTDQGVSAVFSGRQSIAIHGLIKTYVP